MVAGEDQAGRIEQLRAQLVEQPDSEVFIELAELLVQSGQTDEAVRVCESHLGFHPDAARGHLAYGKALVGQGQLEEGLQALERACMLASSGAELLEEIGRFLLEAGHPGPAHLYIDKALEKAPDKESLLELSGAVEDEAGGDFGRQSTEKLTLGQEQRRQLGLEEQPAAEGDEARQPAVDQAPSAAGEWPEWESNPPPPTDALAPASLPEIDQGLDDEDDDEPPTLYVSNPLLGQEAEGPAAEPGGEVAPAGEDAGPGEDGPAPAGADVRVEAASGAESRTAQETMFDPDAGMRAEIDHAVEQAVSSKNEEPPTMFDPGAAGAKPWAAEATGEVPPGEPPTMFEGAQQPAKPEPAPTRFVTSPDGAVAPFKEAVAAPAETFSYLKVFLVLVPFLVVGLALGGYFAYSHLRADKIDNFLQQARTSLELDTLLGYSEVRLTLQKLLDYDEGNEQGRQLLALVDARLHDEYGPNKGLADEAAQLVKDLGESAAASPEILWANYHLGRREGLDGLLQQALEKKGQPPASILELAARLAAERGRVEQARTLLDKALAATPGYIRARYQLAKLLAGIGKIDKAMEQLDRALAVNGLHTRSLLLLAELRLQAGRQIEQARKDLERVIEIPRVVTRYQARAHLLLSRIAFSRFERDRALAGVRAARGLLPDDQDFLLSLAELCLQAHELDEARQLAEKVASKDAGAAVRAQLVLAGVEVLRRHPERALRRLDGLAGKRVPAGPFLLLRARALLALQRYGQAIADLRSVPAGKPEADEARAWMALALLRQGDETGARRLVKKLLSRRPRLAPAHFVLGEILQARRLGNGARNAWKKAAELDGRFYQAFDRLAEQALERRRRDRALEYARQALRANPFDARAALLVGRVLLDKGQARPALETFRQVVGQDASLAEGFAGLAEAQLLLGQPEQAEQAALKAMNRGLKDARVMHVLGRARLARGLFSKAVWALRRAQQQEEKNPEILADLGLAYLGLRSISRAEKMFKDSLRRRRLARAQEGLARVLLVRGRWSDAARAFEKAARLGRRQGWSTEEVARMWMESGHALVKDRRTRNHLARARRSYRKAVALLPGKAEPLYLLATAYDRDDKLAAARSTYRKVLEVDAGHSLALYRLGLLEFDQGHDDKAGEYLRRFLDGKPRKLRKELRRARRILSRIKSAAGKNK